MIPDFWATLAMVAAAVLAFFVFAFVMLVLTHWFWSFVTWLNVKKGWFQ
jgi:hypothetical protein